MSLRLCTLQETIVTTLRTISTAAVAVLALSVTSCNTPSPRETGDGKLVLHGAGASFPNPLYQKWAMRFAKRHDVVEVEYKSVGSGKGIELFLDDKIDFGASDRAMSDEQIARAKRGALLVPMTAGIVALA